jgi:hypothetical protein
VWETVRNDLLALIRSPKIDRAMVLLLMANRLKRKVRMTMQSISTVFTRITAGSNA